MKSKNIVRLTAVLSLFFVFALVTSLQQTHASSSSATLTSLEIDSITSNPAADIVSVVTVATFDVPYGESTPDVQYAILAVWRDGVRTPMPIGRTNYPAPITCNDVNGCEMSVKLEAFPSSGNDGQASGTFWVENGYKFTNNAPGDFSPSGYDVTYALFDVGRPGNCGAVCYPHD